MILLDTHMWYWWVSQSARLSARHRELIESHAANGLAISAISCWEVAKKHQLGKLELDRSLDAWMSLALAHPGLVVPSLTPEILIESARLPDGFRSNPADEFILATARVQQLDLLTADQKMLGYSHVAKLT